MAIATQLPLENSDSLSQQVSARSERRRAIAGLGRAGGALERVLSIPVQVLGGGGGVKCSLLIFVLSVCRNPVVWALSPLML